MQQILPNLLALESHVCRKKCYETLQPINKSYVLKIVIRNNWSPIVVIIFGYYKRASSLPPTNSMPVWHKVRLRIRPTLQSCWKLLRTKSKVFKSKTMHLSLLCLEPVKKQKEAYMQSRQNIIHSLTTLTTALQRQIHSCIDVKVRLEGIRY